MFHPRLKRLFKVFFSALYKYFFGQEARKKYRRIEKDLPYKMRNLCQATWFFIYITRYYVR